VTTKIEFLGIAAFRITNSQNQVILIDPCFSDNPVSPVQVDDLEQVDLILVTHLALDHLGDAAAICKRFKCPVVCGPEVKVFLEQQGADPLLMRTMVWGGQVNPLGIRVRGVECHHTSFRRAPDGQYLSGQPLGLFCMPTRACGFIIPATAPFSVTSNSLANSIAQISGSSVRVNWNKNIYVRWVCKTTSEMK
jgi:L-ascorbate metabolism protein UlaG (beta-lactamase superfamily)